MKNIKEGIKIYVHLPSYGACYFANDVALLVTTSRGAELAILAYIKLVKAIGL